MLTCSAQQSGAKQLARHEGEMVLDGQNTRVRLCKYRWLNRRNGSRGTNERQLHPVIRAILPRPRRVHTLNTDSSYSSVSWLAHAARGLQSSMQWCIPISTGPETCEHNRMEIANPSVQNAAKRCGNRRSTKFPYRSMLVHQR